MQANDASFTTPKRVAAERLHGRSRTNAIAGAALVLFLATVLASSFHSKPIWLPDSYHYAIRMLMYSGESREDATARAQAFFNKIPLAQDRRYHESFRSRIADPYWNLFTPRILYPLLAATLWPRMGFFALIAVSAVAYVAGATAMYVLLLEFTTPLLAAVGGVIFAVSIPESLGRSGLSDMLSLTLWIFVLLFMLRYLRMNTIGSYAAFCVALLGLAFTRPLVYTPFMAAAVPLVVGFLRKDVTQIRRASACVVACIVAAVLLFVVATIDHAPSLMFIVRDMQQEAAAPPMALGVWYMNSVLRDTYNWIKEWGYDIAPAVAIGAIIAYWRHWAAPALAGAFLSGFVTILFDPLPFDESRTVIAPMLPVVLCGVAMAVTRRGNPIGLGPRTLRPAS